jgi:hypothetical protein
MRAMSDTSASSWCLELVIVVVLGRVRLGSAGSRSLRVSGTVGV